VGVVAGHRFSARSRVEGFPPPGRDRRGGAHRASAPPGVWSRPPALFPHLCGCGFRDGSGALSPQSGGSSRMTSRWRATKKSTLCIISIAAICWRGDKRYRFWRFRIAMGASRPTVSRWLARQAKGRRPALGDALGANGHDPDDLQCRHIPRRGAGGRARPALSAARARPR
jgi:hypothetical protein